MATSNYIFKRAGNQNKNVQKKPAEKQLWQQAQTGNWELVQDKKFKSHYVLWTKKKTDKRKRLWNRQKMNLDEKAAFQNSF